MNSSSPIGLFDSGVGGLTVMREMAELLPNEDLVYLGDTARLPYGTKSPESVIRFSFENAEFLQKKNIKLLMVSCHTACSHAFEILQKTLPIPVLGVTQPGFEAVARSTKTQSIAILGTSSTINSGVFQSLLKLHYPHLEVYAIACPLFVPLVEDGLQDHHATRLIAEHYLAPLKETKVDTVLLACTHYPLLCSVIQEVLGPSVTLIQPARASALEAKRLLREKKLFNESLKTPNYEFYVSDDPEKFKTLAKVFFPRPIDKVELA